MKKRILEILDKNLYKKIDNEKELNIIKNKIMKKYCTPESELKKLLKQLNIK